MKTLIMTSLLVLFFAGPVFSQHNSDSNNKTASSYVLSGQSIDLSNRGLHVIPEEIFTMTELRILDLSRNNLTNIDAGIEDLKDLRVLDLTGNNIYELPFEINKLKFLKEIYLDYDYWHSKLDEVKKITRARIILK